MSNNTYDNIDEINEFNSGTENMNIIEYCNKLYNLTSWDKMIQIIRKQLFMINCPSNFKNTPYENKIIKIKYLEHNRLWKFQWARDCRGVILYLNENNKIVPLKYQLQRGAEVLTNEHILKGINETDDFKIKNHDIFDIFDFNQQQVIIKLLKGEDIEGILSSKCDGSLFAVTFYFDKYRTILDEIINKYTNEFANIFYQMAKNQGHYCVPSSQGTFCLSDEMQSYNVTAVLGNEHDTNVLKMIRETNDNFKYAFKNYGMSWIVKICRIADYLKSLYPNAINITLNFESVCKNRLSMWDTTPHTELAIKYERSFTSFLGASVCEENYFKFVPHFDIKNLDEIDVCEPLYWRIKNAIQVNDILRDLEYVINKEMSEEEYFNKHKPVNINKYKKFGCEIDMEGFVFLTINQSDENNVYDYNKIKTLTYYKCHNFKESNVDCLIKISQISGNRFPLAVKVANFYSNLKEKLTKISERLFNELDKPVENNLFFEKLSEKAKKNYCKHNKQNQIKILINASENFSTVCFNNFALEFPDIKKYESDTEKNTEIKQLVKTIIMAIEIWNFSNLEINIDFILKQNSDKIKHINYLLLLCLKSPLV